MSPTPAPLSAQVHPAQRAFNLAVQSKVARDYDAALSATREALALAPQAFCDRGALVTLFNAPDWFIQDGEGDKYLDYAASFMQMIEDTCAAQPAISQPLANAFVQGAFFRHTTHNRRPLTGFMRLRGKLYRRALSVLQVPFDFAFDTPVSSGGKMRLGFLLKHLRQDPETTVALSYFEYARAADVEVILFLCSGEEHPDFAAHVRSMADRVVTLPNAADQAVQVLRDHDLDILLYCNDMTAKPSLPAFLTFFRVARQAASNVTTIATSGAPGVDVYFGCDYYLQRGMDREFTERYMALPDPGFTFSLPLQASPLTFDRGQFGIPKDALVLTSGANFTKLHGPLLRTWAAILKKIPQAIFVLLPFPPHFGPTQAALVQRWHKLMIENGVDPARFIVLPSLGSREALVSFLRLADIGLDSFPYSGLTTIVDSLTARLPIVVPTGPVLRNNHAAAILHSIGLDELISTSDEDYVERVVALAGDEQRRRAIRKEIDGIMLARPFCLDPQAFCRAIVGICRKLYDEMKAGTVGQSAKSNI